MNYDKLSQELSEISELLTASEVDVKSIKRMKLYDIANLIRSDWRNVNFAARPYLSAMASLREIDDSYGVDRGEEIVAYFLSNASTWRGEVAKVVKKELKRRLK